MTWRRRARLASLRASPDARASRARVFAVRIRRAPRPPRGVLVVVLARRVVGVPRRRPRASSSPRVVVSASSPVDVVVAVASPAPRRRGVVLRDARARPRVRGAGRVLVRTTREVLISRDARGGRRRRRRRRRRVRVLRDPRPVPRNRADAHGERARSRAFSMRVSAVPGYRSRISEDADASSPPPTPPPPAARIATDEDFPSGSHEDASGAADARPGASVAKNDAAATRSRRRDGDDDVDGRRRGDDDARRRRRAGAAAGDADDATSEDDDEDAARRTRRAADANCEDASARSACIGRRAE